MSSMAVREAFRAGWAQYAPGVTFVEVINRAVELGPAVAAGLFGTLLFDSVTSRRDVSLGSNAWVEETGNVTLSIFSPSGAGDEAAIDKATEIQRRLAGRMLAADLFVSEVLGPLDQVPEGEGEIYQAQLSATYAWQGREPRLNEGGP